MSAISRLNIGNVDYWMPAKRFWKGNMPEWDIVSESLDKKFLLLGAVKWQEKKVTEKDIEMIKLINTIFENLKDMKKWIQKQDNCF